LQSSSLCPTQCQTEKQKTELATSAGRGHIYAMHTTRVTNALGKMFKNIAKMKL